MGLGQGRALAAALAALTILSHAFLCAVAPLPYGHFDALVMGEHGLQDVALLVTGFRRVAADLAWVQYLQYLAPDMEDTEKEQEETTPEMIRSGALRVAHLDPGFVPAYLYGAGVLAFDPHILRPFDAIALLREGAANNPSEWRLQTIIAAILYKMHDKPAAMVAELERLAAPPDCAVLFRAILANIYKSEGRYDDALRIWRMVLEGQATPDERSRAVQEIARLVRLRGGGGGSAPRE